MIDILSATHTVLREQQFATRIIALGKESALLFEDESLLGFVYVFDATETMIESWAQVERAFLQIYSPRFRDAGDKAWNVYSIFMSAEDGAEPVRRRVRWIEEDLRLTRKLTGCGINTRQDLINVLLPLLALQQKPFLQSDDFGKRLKRRLQSFAPTVVETLTDERIETREIARILRDIP